MNPDKANPALRPPVTPPPAPEVRWPLLWTSSLASIIAVVTMQAVCLALVHHVVLDSAKQLEQQQTEGDTRRAASLFGGLSSRLLAQVADYARWDVTVDVLTSRDRAYLDDNLSPRSLTNLNVDHVLMVDLNGAIINAGRVEAPDRPLAPLDDATLAALLQVTAAAQATDDHRIAGMIGLPSGPHVVAAQAITPSDLDAPVSGWFVFAMPLNDAALATIESDLGTGVTIGPPGSGAASVDPAADPDVIRSVVPLASVGDEPPLVATIHRPRIAMQRALRTITAVGEIGIATGVLLLAAILFVLQRVVARIQVLSAAVLAANAQPLSGRRVHVDGQDEIACLATALNELLRQREAVEQRAIVQDRLLVTGTLAAGVAHEINNPLSYLIGNLSFVNSEVEGLTFDPGVREALNDAATGADRIAAIVRDLQLFSRPDLTVTAVDVGSVVHSSLRLMHSQLRGRVTIATDVRRSYARASESVVGQIVVNLIQNALQALPDQRSELAQITVRTYESSETAVLEVEDNGTGIPPEVLPRIFEPFFTTRPVGVGTGLGLAVCHGIVVGLGGQITVHTTQGVGTKFTITLPRAQAPVALNATPRVLLVDDDPMARAVAIRLLQNAYEVVEASDADVALALWDHQSFDAVLLDVMMPGISGIDLYKILCKKSPASVPKIGFVTAGAVSPDAQDFLASRPASILRKPFDAASLGRFVRALVAA